YLLMDDRYYCDIETWLSKSGYVDYIAPQIYWSFSHSKFPFDKTLDRWIKLRKNKNVKIYVGIAVYKAGSNEDNEWKNDAMILKEQVEYGRKTGQVDGYFYFRHDFFYKKATGKAVKNLLKIIP
ncbi:MAG TPA: family 10 glycosylhydrolase, partial [Mobilitalea sp.]|nr:family 10 glycosylhydrolase [Mobilitalea sp.]